METQSRHPSSEHAPGWLSGAGILSGFFALLGASCCILPLLLAYVGLGSVLAANLALLERWREPMIAATALLMLAAFIAAFWKGRRPRAKFWTSMGVSSLLLAVAWQLPQHEIEILKWLDLI
ncbi:hypothetical protein [Hyphomonas sp.]|uniref:hypothetical protein n=1 Tax=Hyphomonas sp. TaxID=87 RepID=UPI00391BAF18